MKNFQKIMFAAYIITGVALLVIQLINENYDKALMAALLLSQSILIVSVIDKE